jgi:hypothetical protein
VLGKIVVVGQFRGTVLDQGAKPEALQEQKKVVCQRHRMLSMKSLVPYMIGHAEAIKKGLSLRRYGVPYEAIACVLGHNAMYNATQSLGRISIVGATVKDPSAFPPDLFTH